MASLFQSRAKSDAGQRGQIVIEYVLLLVVVVAIATTMVKLMVNRSPNPDEQGFVIRGWSLLLTEIGDDPADEPR